MNLRVGLLGAIAAMAMVGGEVSAPMRWGGPPPAGPRAKPKPGAKRPYKGSKAAKRAARQARKKRP